MDGKRFTAGIAPRMRDAHRQTGELLLRLGVTPHTVGYAMLRDGVRLVSDGDRFRIVRATEELYPTIGKGYCANIYGVEHAMRDAIHLAWQRENGERGSLRFEDTAPGNTEFLYLLAGEVRLNQAKKKPQA